MDLLESVADSLAQQALAANTDMDDNTLVDKMANVMGASSSTLQEAFLTAVRIRRAEFRALAELKKFKDRAARPAARPPG